LCNLGVSFTLAFRVALQAHNVSDLDRKAIYKAIALRVRQAPLGFFWPARETTPA
jgi:site-specific recombinase